MLTKTLTAGVLAVSLSLTSLTPTRAAAWSDEDVAVGVISLLLLGAAIHHSRSNDRPQPAAPQPQRPREVRDWRVLPVDCLRHATRANGNTIRYFGQRCLNNNYAHVARLPDHCHVRFRNANDQRRQGFRANCLRNQGFRTNRH